MAADPKEHLKELSSYMQDKGFLYGPSPEIYGGLAGFYDYGPLGKLLKNNVENAIRQVFQRERFFEVECPTVLPGEVWKASGHLDNFTDPLIKDSKGNIYRVDSLIEEHCRNRGIDSEDLKLDGMSDKELLETIDEYSVTSPAKDAELIPEIKYHNLMMQTTIGLDREAYNRPETATTTYLPFLRYMNFFRDKLPGGIFQIGKAYRNEISPRQFLLRLREFTQAEAQMFIFKDQKDDFEKFDEVSGAKLPLWSASEQEKYGYKKFCENHPEGISLAEANSHGTLKNKAYAWTMWLSYELFKAMGIPESKMRFRQHNEKELAFYADDAWDLEVNLKTFGWTEMCGVHDRTDYDLTTHSKASGENLVAQKPDGGKETPHVLEIAFGTDRPTFALLDLFYEAKEKEEGKTTFRIPYSMAPLPVAVFPLTNKLAKEAEEVFRTLQRSVMTFYDRSGSIGKRYLRADTVGIPYCVTYDFDSREDDSVTVRDRDTGNQKRVPLVRLADTIKGLLAGEIEFSKL
ncbi:MAG: glycine--tRNA ligase [Candidatus Woesearchaeota archaeon]